MQAKLKHLKFDKDLLHIRKINSVTVNRYRQATRNGAVFPRVIVEAGTMKIVSGNHRVTAWLEEYGSEKTIDVEARKYTHKRDLYEDFARENATHGIPLDGASRTALSIKLLESGATPEKVAAIFGVSVKRIEQWAGHTVVVVGEGRKKPEYRAVKRGVEVEEMTDAQYQQHWHRDRGINVVQLANQLTRWLQNEWVQHTPKNEAALVELHEELAAYVRQMENVKA